MSVKWNSHVMSMLIVPTLLAASPVSVTMVTMEMECCVQVWLNKLEAQATLLLNTYFIY